MTKPQAHAILDGARDGRSISLAQINQALYVLGDLDDEPVCQVIKPAGTWERKEAALMAAATPWDALV